jgi:hypothetical protein
VMLRPASVFICSIPSYKSYNAQFDLLVNLLVPIGFLLIASQTEERLVYSIW